MVEIKRAYDPATPRDGRRVLVDRLWPRGTSKEKLRLDAWEKELAPSDALRRWFGHDPERWDEFAERYRKELKQPEARTALDALARQAARGRVTLVYGARDTEHNQAVVLRDEIRRRLCR